MNNRINPYQKISLEFHILQSFPVTCLNRDDVGAPKTAVVGGVTRARVSSQCWKRQVRMAMRDFGVLLGSRTKQISGLIEAACIGLGATPVQAKACGDKIEHIFIKKKEVSEKKASKNSQEELFSEDIANDAPSNDKTDTLLFLSPKEVQIISQVFKEHFFNPDDVIKQKDAKKQAKELEELIGKVDEHIDALDIALFGRMVAQAATMNVEAACSFSHAISTHKVTNEVEFFTALDDEAKEPGSAHMGSLEFNSATYYRYVSVNVGQLCETLGDNHILAAIGAFIKALYVAVPSARQTSQSGASPWEFARVYVRKGQRLQVPFETPVKTKNAEGYLEPSKKALCEYLDKKENLSGSLFGKIKSFDFGDDERFNIDQLVKSVESAISEGITK